MEGLRGGQVRNESDEFSMKEVCRDGTQDIGRDWSPRVNPKVDLLDS